MSRVLIRIGEGGNASNLRKCKASVANFTDASLFAYSDNSEFTIFLCPDIILSPHCIERMLAVFDADPNVGIVIPFSNEPINEAKCEPWPAQTILDVADILGKQKPIPDFYAPKSGCYMVRSSLLGCEGDLFNPLVQACFWLMRQKEGWKATVANAYAFRLMNDAERRKLIMQNRESRNALKECDRKAWQTLEAAWLRKKTILLFNRKLHEARRDHKSDSKTVFLCHSYGAFGGISALVHWADEMILKGHNAIVAAIHPATVENTNLGACLFGTARYSGRENAVNKIGALSRSGHAIAGTVGMGSLVKEICDQHKHLSPVLLVQDDEVRFHIDRINAATPNTKAQAVSGMEFIKAQYRLDMPKVAISRFAADSVVREDGKEPARIIREAVDPDIFQLSDKAGKFRIVAFARSEARRGAEVLEALYRLVAAKYGASVELVTIGDNRLATPVQAHFSNLSAERCAEEIAKANVLVDTSHYQGFGLPGLEAMACGTVLVCAKNGGIDEYGKDGENCLIVSENRADLYLKKIEMVMNDLALVKKLTDNGRMTANTLTWESTASEWCEYLKSNNQAIIDSSKPVSDRAIPIAPKASDPNYFFKCTSALPDVVSVVVSHSSKQLSHVVKAAERLTASKAIISVDSAGEKLIFGDGVETISYKDSEYHGKPKSMNIGMKRAVELGAKYIYVSMNDVTLEKDGLKKLVEFMDFHPDCGIITPLFYTNGNPNIDGQWPNMPPCPVCHFEVLSFLIRADVFKKVGGLDESLWSTWGCCLSYPARIWEAGWSVYKAAHVRADHAGATTNGVTTGNRKDYTAKGFGEIGLWLNRRFDGDYFGMLEWTLAMREFWRSKKVPEESITRFNHLMAFHSQFFFSRPDLVGKWKPRGKPVVLFLTRSAAIGGVEYLFTNMTDQFRRDGYDAVYLYWDPNRLPKGDVTGLPYMRLPDNEDAGYTEIFPGYKALFPNRINVLAAIYDSLKPEAVVYFWQRDAILARNKSTHKPKLLEWVDGKGCFDSAMTNAKNMKAFPDEFISESGPGAEYAKTKYGLPAHFVGTPVVRHETKESVGALPLGKKIVLRVSRVTVGKNPGMFCDLMRELGPEYYGVWVGPKDKFTGCSDSFIADYEKRKPVNCEFIGGIEDQGLLETYIEAADYFVCTSDVDMPEGFNVSMLQAMKHGKPIISMPSGYIVSLLKNRSGILLPETCGAKQFAEILKNLSEKELKALSKKAKQSVSQHNAKSVCQKIQTVIRRFEKEAANA